MQVVEVGVPPAGWRDRNDYSKCQPVGNDWYDRGAALLLKVPPAVLPGSFNYVMNSTHAYFSKIKLLKVADLIPDERVELLNKNLE